MLTYSEHRGLRIALRNITGMQTKVTLICLKGTRKVQLLGTLNLTAISGGFLGGIPIQINGKPFWDKWSMNVIILDNIKISVDLISKDTSISAKLGMSTEVQRDNKHGLWNWFQMLQWQLERGQERQWGKSCWS